MERPLTRLTVFSIDFTTLAHKYCNPGVRTKYHGTVIEKKLRDGRALVTVKLRTRNAVAWMIDFNDTEPRDDDLSPNPFGCNPTVFGTRWNEDCTFDGPIAVGSSRLILQYIAPEPGAPMPNMFDFFAPDTELALLKMAICAVAKGELPDGTKAIAGTEQLWEDIDDTGTVLDNGFFC